VGGAEQAVAGVQGFGERVETLGGIDLRDDLDVGIYWKAMINNS
jgi:hypothetical protein